MGIDFFHIHHDSFLPDVFIIVVVLHPLVKAPLGLGALMFWMLTLFARFGAFFRQAFILTTGKPLGNPPADLISDYTGALFELFVGSSIRLLH